jgi:O-acetylhomoserine/O-acetylserine sulfhydrylase-like pyridoxal-dependent enzyme
LLSTLAHSHQLPAIGDNTALTPALFRPIQHRFDIVVHSTTQFIGGHGVQLGGAVVDSGEFPRAEDPQKWLEFTAPDPAYHGLVLEEALRPIDDPAVHGNRAEGDVFTNRPPLAPQLRKVGRQAVIGTTLRLTRRRSKRWN